MIRPHRGEGGLPLLIADAVVQPPFRHGFTTRSGGVSGAPFESLNLGMKWGDTRDNVLENRRRVLRAAGASTLYIASQVHGAAVVRVGAADDPAVMAKREADALCSDVAGIALAVFVADCVPVLFADPRTGAFAAAHAGWRGTVAGVVEATVGALERDYGSRPFELRVALGPAIGVCCFEVGSEVVAAFEAKLSRARERGVIVDGPDGKGRVNLRRALALILEALGVPTSAVAVSGACTKCDADGRFYSYRRSGSRTGQHFGFIARP